MCKSKYTISPLGSLVLYTYTCAVLYADRAALSAVVYLLESNSGAGLGIDSFEAGALGSSFVVGFLVFFPIFAYFSQRVHPEYLMCIGLSI